MFALLTSCARPDLLIKTVDSLLHNQQEQVLLLINEDSKAKLKWFDSDFITTDFTGGIGQHKSIEKFLNFAARLKYYLHLEDDWHFHNSYNWIAESVRIMEEDPSIIKVLCRIGSPHPCDHNKGGIENANRFGYLQPWTGDDGITWNGFSWNPGVTRVDLLRQFMPFPKYEQELAEKIYNAGYKVAELIPGVYTHIGDGRSTHE